MPDDQLPRRPRCPWLPALRNLVLDRQSVALAGRLRVWDVFGDGFFAVVTEERGKPELARLAAAEATWQRLLAQYGEPLGLAELWPQGVAGPLHVDLVLPPREDALLAWAQVHPVLSDGPRADLYEAWWSVNGDEILSP